MKKVLKNEHVQGEVDRRGGCSDSFTHRLRDASDTPSDRCDEVPQQLTAADLAVNPVWRLAVTGGAAAALGRHGCTEAFTQAGVRRPVQALKTCRQERSSASTGVLSGGLRAMNCAHTSHREPPVWVPPRKS